MQGGGGEGVLPVLRAPDNAADAVPPEQIQKFKETACYNGNSSFTDFQQIRQTLKVSYRSVLPVQYRLSMKVGSKFKVESIKGKGEKNILRGCPP